MIRGTSYGAARGIRGRSGALRARVFHYVLLRGEEGATLEEMELSLAIAGNTVRPRRVELEERGFIEDSGRRRPTCSGKSAIVWIIPALIADKARAKLAMMGVPA